MKRKKKRLHAQYMHFVTWQIIIEHCAAVEWAYRAYTYIELGMNSTKSVLFVQCIHMYSVTQRDTSIYFLSMYFIFLSICVSLKIPKKKKNENHWDRTRKNRKVSEILFFFTCFFRLHVECNDNKGRMQIEKKRKENGIAYRNFDAWNINALVPTLWFWKIIIIIIMVMMLINQLN